MAMSALKPLLTCYHKLQNYHSPPASTETRMDYPNLEHVKACNSDQRFDSYTQYGLPHLCTADNAILHLYLLR